jgi:hypothetical protein
MTDAADRYARLWEGGRPDLDEFLAAAGPLAADELAAVLRVDQRERWRAGERVPAEEYVGRLPGDPPDAECALDLIYGEYLLREQLGERPDPDGFARRFPAAPALRDQIALHRALGSDPGKAETPLHPPDPRPTPTDDRLPREFGPYRLVSVLGRGGMGTVYLADDTRLDRQVALKVLRFDRARSAEAVERFRREARAAAGVRHPNLVPVYEVGRVGGTDYLTMPYVTGEPLSARLARDGPLPEAEAVRLAVRVADAMRAVHGAGVVHRDLKPSNILLDDQGEPSVADFGLAKQVSGADPRVTDSGAILGTAAYLPPEQVGCHPDAIGPRCDVYSLGVILYEMLTGRVPFDGPPGEVLLRVLTDEPPPPSKLRPGLDPRLEAVCLKAMAKRPEKRFPSMAEFAAALESPPPLRPATEQRRRVAAGLAALVLAVGVAGVSVWLATRPGASVAPSPDQRNLPPAADPFPAGSEWAGTYRFVRPPDGGTGEVELRVSSRNGDDFRGTYMTRHDGTVYRWEVAGQIGAGQAKWALGRPLNADTRPTQAVVRGRYTADGLTATYEDADSAAEMTMTRRK